MVYVSVMYVKAIFQVLDSAFGLNCSPAPLILGKLLKPVFHFDMKIACVLSTLYVRLLGEARVLSRHGEMG